MNSTQGIINWNKERNLKVFNPIVALPLLLEELDELRVAWKEQNVHETIDALNDLRVLCTGALWQLGQDPELSLKQTVKEISSRVIDPECEKERLAGTMTKWRKDPNQSKETLYKANYNLSKRSIS